MSEINPHKITKLKNKINKFLESKRTVTGDFTHISMGGLSKAGKFIINDKKDVKKLNSLLTDAINYNLPYSIAEKQKEYGPVKIDIDLESTSKGNNDTKLYNDNTILEVINKYRQSISKFCDVEKADLNACLFEKKNITNKNNKLRDGFHIIFPSLCLDYKIRHVIRNNVLKDFSSEKTKIFDKFSNNIEDIFDKSIVNTNCWLMYGCSKPNTEPYKLTKYFDHKNNELKLSLFSKNKNKNIIKKLSLRSEIWNEDNAHVLNKDMDEDFIESNFEKLDIKKSSPDTYTSDEKKQLIESIYKLISMISKKRADNYHTWIRCGWILRNTDPSLLNLWIEFSKRSKKYKEGECEKLWRTMRKSGLTHRTLRMWAMDDNPKKYKEFKTEEFELSIKKNEGLGTFWIAKALHVKYGDSFVCTNPEKNEWYEFKNHRWAEMKGGGKLIELMSSQFSNLYREQVDKYNKLAMGAPMNEKSKYDEMVDKFKKIASQLMNITFKKKILEEAKNIFYDQDFIQNLDENHDIIGFNNGVYDLKLHEFRKGQSDDYISLSTKVDYIPWNPNNPISKKILKFLSEILPKEDVRKYFLTVLSTCVSGDNNEEKIYFATGSGSNGKSVLFELISNALGDYYITCPITILTGKRGQSSQASPELARLKGVRIGVFQEPNSGDTLNVGTLKELTGNDKFMARKLHQDPIEIKPQVKFFMACNDKPEDLPDDGGTWRRIRVIDFISKFVEKHDLDKNKPNMYLIDNKLKHNLPDWGPIFAGYLIHIYKNDYCNKKLYEPADVLASTNDYRMDNNHFIEYFNFRIIETQDDTDIIGKKTIWTDFKTWFKEFKDGNKQPKAKKLYEFLNKKISFNKKGWKRIRFKISEELDSSNDEKPNDLDV
jgi:P4 family phage/plasmid primase-like protien